MRDDEITGHNRSRWTPRPLGRESVVWANRLRTGTRRDDEANTRRLVLLGALIQRVSGETFENYVAHHITGPLRMNDTFFDVPPEKMARVSRLHEIKDGKLRTTPEIIGAYAEKGRGIPAGGAGLFSTMGDYARFAQCLLNDGTLDGVRLLGRKTVGLALKNTLPPSESAFTASEGWGLMSALRLDMALAREPASEGMFYWIGAATTHFFCGEVPKITGDTP